WRIQQSSWFLPPVGLCTRRAGQLPGPPCAPAGRKKAPYSNFWMVMEALVMVVLASVEFRVITEPAPASTSTVAVRGTTLLVVLIVAVLSLPGMAVLSSWSSRPTVPVELLLVPTAL